MPSDVGYYRHPTLHGDRIVFICEDDLWTVSSEGGIARRLTANPGTCAFPRLSPDGDLLAFTGRDDGPTEIYLMDAEGGAPRRITWFGAMTQTVGWSPDGRSVLAASLWQQPFTPQLLRVPIDGGPPEPLRLGPARSASYQPDGPGMALGRNSGDPARWKRYRGGTAGTLWIDRDGKGRFAPLLRLEGNLANPMWIGSRIFFLSDHEGCGNLYSCTPTGRGLKRHTDHEDFYVRFPSSDGERIVYHAGADIFVYNPQTDRERKVEIRIHSTQSQQNRKFVPAGKFLESYDLHPKGHSLATIHRGGLFSMGLWEGAPRRHGPVSRVRQRLAAWLPDGKRMIAVHDEGGEESLVVFSPDGKSKTIQGDFGRPIELRPAPGDVFDDDHAKRTKRPARKKAQAGAARRTDFVALTNQRQEVILVNLSTGRSKVLERSEYGRIEGIAWSPDSRWLAYAFPNSNRGTRIHVCEVASGKVQPVTGPDFWDVRPSFDPKGRYLYFISFRTFDPIYDALYFDLGFPKGSRPYLIPLRGDMVSPFAAGTREPKPPIPGPPGGLPDKMNGKAEDGTTPKVEIDFDGIEERIVAFPVPEGHYGAVLGTRRRVFFSSFPVEGSLNTSWATFGEPEAKGQIESYDFDQNKVEKAADKITDFSLSLDARVLGIRAGNRLRVVPATFKENSGPPRGDCSRESGWVDLNRIRVAVVPSDEWHQMYREAWRLQRDQFWTPDMSGVSWAEVHDRYLPLVKRVASRAEFSDLLWEMQAELGTSHCYEMGGDYRPEPAWYQGFLGADLEYDRRGKRWLVRRIPRGDSWDEKYASPLAAPGLNVHPGDEIVAIGGEPVGEEVSPYERLVYQAGQEVQITLHPGAESKRVLGKGKTDARTIVVTTLKQEASLRYRDWVESNRARVHRQSRGRVGYVHIPNMGPWGYSEFHRYYATEVQRDGLIIDVRYNGGGHVSQLLLEKLVRKRIGYDVSRWGQPDSYPLDAPLGPLVALTNEYAGSDGDMFSHAFKVFRLGPLIGKRTWGGVVGIWPRHSLVDGSLTTQPEFATWFADVGYGVENYGTDPDIEVDIRPQDFAAGKDPQLERGLAEVSKGLRKIRVKGPDLRNRPKTKPPRLPRRG